MSNGESICGLDGYLHGRSPRDLVVTPFDTVHIKSTEALLPYELVAVSFAGKDPDFLKTPSKRLVLEEN